MLPLTVRDRPSQRYSRISNAVRNLYPVANYLGGGLISTIENGAPILKMFTRNNNLPRSYKKRKATNQLQKEQAPEKYEQSNGLQYKMKMKKKRKRSKKTLKKRIFNLEKKINKPFSYNKTRDRKAGVLTCGIGAKGESVAYSFTMTDFNAFNNSLRFYNPATGAVVSANPDVSTSDISFDYKVRDTVTIKNNSTNACRLAYCYYECIGDTADAVTTLAAAQINTKGITYSSTNVQHYIGDGYEGYKDFFKATKCRGDVNLAPGDEIVLRYNRGWRKYNTAADMDNTYNKKHNYDLYLRLTGKVVHDSTTSTLVNTGAAQVDIVLDRVYDIRYTGPLKMQSLLGNSNTAGAVAAGEQAMEGVDVETYQV